jgi:NAD+ diphosphatase
MWCSGRTSVRPYRRTSSGASGILRYYVHTNVPERETDDVPPQADPRTHFRHCPRCGAADAAPDAANPFACEGCGFVLFFNPASAVAAIVVNEGGQVLFTRRARDPAKGKLGLPGGFVSTGETAEDALRREVLEEVGVELESLDYLCSFPNVYFFEGVEYQTLDLFYVATPRQGHGAKALDDVSSVAWLDPIRVTLSEIAFGSLRKGLERYLAGLARAR